MYFKAIFRIKNLRSIFYTSLQQWVKFLEAVAFLALINQCYYNWQYIFQYKAFSQDFEWNRKNFGVLRNVWLKHQFLFTLMSQIHI